MWQSGRWLKLPIFPNDVDKTRRASLLNHALLTLIGLGLSVD